MKNVPLVEQFQQAIFGLIPGFEDSEDRLGLAISGGPDSLALLLLSTEIFPGRIAAATVDHQLRPEARHEAEFVARLCAERSVPHHILVPAAPIKGSIQAEARKARYELLNNWMEKEQLDWLVTAHHADDQLETLIMRLLRGSGIDGMSGVRARRGHIIRPLLQISKNILKDYVAAQGCKAVDDPSNRDHSYDRVRVREALSHLQGFDARLANQSATALGDAREAIHWMVEELTDKHIRTERDLCQLIETQFPHEILRRLVLKCLHQVDPALSPRGEQLEKCIIALKMGQTVTLGDILCKGGETWDFSNAPKRKTV